jgi:hypothetical protein
MPSQVRCGSLQNGSNFFKKIKVNMWVKVRKMKWISFRRKISKHPPSEKNFNLYFLIKTYYFTSFPFFLIYSNSPLPFQILSQLTARTERGKKGIL